MKLLLKSFFSNVENSFLHLKSSHFLLSILITTLAITNCQTNEISDHKRIMPGGKVPSKLYVYKIDHDASWQERNMLSCFQGLVNRKDTRIYYTETKQDTFWLDYYKETFNIKNESIESINTLFEMFARELDGYILYQPQNPHTLNIATTIGALENLLPITPDQESFVSKFGLKNKNQIENNELDRIEIYKEVINKLLPKCNKNILAALCVHYPHWPTSTVQNRDYVMAHKIFSYDLSSSERDKSDYNLVRDIYKNVNENSIVMGWHCVRDKEHEAIGLASEFGHLGMCSLHTPNLTVHSSIPIPKDKVFKQRVLDKNNLKVEDKVYIAYMATDGDASWFMNDHVVNDWSDPSRGSFKYNWGFLPLAYDLMPGTVKYYLDNMQPTDYFVAGPAGATYTYPYLHPNPTKYLDISASYMEKCGLTTVHMTNWNDRDWWQEVEIPYFYNKLQKHIPSAIGYVRGMGESAFEQHEIGNGKPYIFCGEGLHRGDDVYLTMKNFIDANPNRPLFIYSLVNHSIPMGDIKKAMDKFSDNEVEAVHLDELMLLANKAFAEGKITSDLYPNNEGIKNILIQEAKEKWVGFYKQIKTLAKISNKGEKNYINYIASKPIGVEPIVAGDHLAFTTIWNSMTVVKLSLESKGIYVNHKPTAVNQFLEVYNNIQDHQVISELHNVWNSWHQKTLNYEEAKILTKRLANVVKLIDKNI